MSLFHNLLKILPAERKRKRFKGGKEDEKGESENLQNVSVRGERDLKGGKDKEGGSEI